MPVERVMQMRMLPASVERNAIGRDTNQHMFCLGQQRHGMPFEMSVATS